MIDKGFRYISEPFFCAPVIYETTQRPAVNFKKMGLVKSPSPGQQEKET